MEIDTNKATAFTLGITGLIILPIGLIWAINTLLNLQIEYNFFNWLSVVFIQVYIQIILKAVLIGSIKK